MPPLAITMLTIATAGGVGCAARALARDLLLRRGIESWLAILAINLAGAAVVGMLYAQSASMPKGSVVAAAGFLSGWTTASAFSVDVVLLWWRGRRRAAALCWVATIMGTPLVALAGHALARAVWGAAP